MTYQRALRNSSATRPLSPAAHPSHPEAVNPDSSAIVAVQSGFTFLARRPGARNPAAGPQAGMTHEPHFDSDNDGGIGIHLRAAHLAARQHGVVERQQLIDLDFTRDQ